MSDAFLIITKLTMFPAELANYIRELPARGIMGVILAAFQLGLFGAQDFGLMNFGVSLLCIMALLFHDIYARFVPDIPAATGRNPPLLRWAGYWVLILTIILSWNDISSQFIYFTF
jgi:hypothetical protein